MAKHLKRKIREIPIIRVAVGEALPFGHRKDRWISRTIHILGAFKPFAEAYLPKQREQIDWLIDTVDQLKNILIKWQR